MSDPIREPEYALHPSPQEYIQGSPLSPDQMGFLRFFNGTTAPFPVHISLDHKPFAAALLPGFLTCYDVLEPGKRNISLQDGTDPTILLLQESLLFPQGGCSTVILSDSSRTGLQLFHLRDMSPQCSKNQCCLRVFNGAMENHSLSVAQCGGSLLWEELPVGSASPYRLMEPGTASFYTFLPNGGGPLSSLSFLFQSGHSYTICLRGNTWLPEGIQMAIISDGAVDT